MYFNHNVSCCNKFRVTSLHYVQRGGLVSRFHQYFYMERGIHFVGAFAEHMCLAHFLVWKGSLDSQVHEFLLKGYSSWYVSLWLVPIMLKIYSQVLTYHSFDICLLFIVIKFCQLFQQLTCTYRRIVNKWSFCKLWNVFDKTVSAATEDAL